MLSSANKGKSVHASYINKLTTLIEKNFPDIDTKIIISNAVERAEFDKCDY